MQISGDIMKNISVITILTLFSVLYCGEIIYKNEIKFPVFNKNSGDVLNYYLLKPNEKLSFQTIDLKEINIFTRIIIEKSTPKSYSYGLYQNKGVKNIQKQVSISNTTYGLGGEKLSKYNNIKISLSKKDKDFTIKNTSAEAILVRIDSDQIKEKQSKIEYISFTPQQFEEEITLLSSKKEYTYYSCCNNGKNIIFRLNGPVYLKVLSRAVIENSINKRIGYGYEVFSNGKLVSKFSEKSNKSLVSRLKNKPESAVTTGDTNLIFFDKGIHEIELKITESDKKQIFRFFINKSSIGVDAQ